MGLRQLGEGGRGGGASGANKKCWSQLSQLLKPFTLISYASYTDPQGPELDGQQPEKEYIEAYNRMDAIF